MKASGAVRTQRRPTKAERERSVVVEKQHEVFAEALLAGHSKSAAARAAGYHPSNVDNVMRQQEVQEYLVQARSEVRSQTSLKRLDVLNVFLEAIDMARMQADAAQMINGAREIGKMLGFYEPEKISVELRGDQTALAARFRALSDAELLDIASGRTSVIEGSCEVVNGG